MISIANHILEIIGMTILHSLWQITLLWLLLIVALRLLPTASSSTRYLFALSTLTLSILITISTAFFEWQYRTSSEQVSVLSTASDAPSDMLISVEPSSLSEVIRTLDNSVPIVAWVWFAGLFVMATRFGGSLLYLRTLRNPQNISSLSSDWEAKLQSLSRTIGLRCNVMIASSARISSPVTMGHLSPIILLPAGLLSGLSTAQIESVLVHELYHIKRRDYIVNIVQALVEVVFFYHPAVWHINKIIREEREKTCDDLTVRFCGNALEYARALTQIQEINTLTKPTLAMSATGTNRNFYNRIKRLFDVSPNPAQARSKGVFAMAFLVVYIAVVISSANVSTAQTAENHEGDVSISVEEYNVFSNVFSDSIPVSQHLYILNGKEVTPKELWDTAHNINSISIQRADTAVQSQTLEHCLRQVNLIVKMASMYTVPASLRFSNFSATDSIELDVSVDYQPKFTKLFSRERFDVTTELQNKELEVKQTIENDVVLSEEINEDVSVDVFPNSTNGQVNIQFKPARNNAHVTITLVDSEGVVIKEIADSTYEDTLQTLQLDLSNYEKGVYFLQISIDGARSQERVLVE